MTEWTPTELMAVAASRLLEDRRVVFAGVGMPLLASMLARADHAPHLTIVLEGGVIGPSIQPGALPISTNEMRGARGATALTDITDIFLYAQRGYFDYGFLGAAQIDQYGNINTSIIGPHGTPKVRLPGSGGANDIITACTESFIVTTHELRRFVERVDFVTSPGYLQGGGTREQAGLEFGAVSRVVTDLAELSFDSDSRRMVLSALQPGSTIAQVRAATGFDLLVPGDVPELAPPTGDELALLRSLDPNRTLLG